MPYGLLGKEIDRMMARQNVCPRGSYMNSLQLGHTHHCSVPAHTCLP